ncbi:WecB/TagA/CpsF family glycosyltransferase [Paenibacillus qinlingensis]|uniref:N-acetylglucosaminyldiphosphoundecaprenol N-acetyl-beta-D-mannosaminyltransferase n=1 Tax=Paenibacillus qinlingensis TaxID=1837343 RepID=A0ABU1NNT8_9BACL|nr:WecB/TagA/CpsF family glycosyltransferase [Paenibacillus qinlingensis]MDR6549144.1 N-acetylglucosaminyldiphosphoundecaprenol N-acetyl-beta-D-mannosaminyltransferase [Paenibacillus qinlingensis]
MTEKYAKVMGVDFPKITLERTIEILSDVIQENRAELFHVITVNPEITMACQKDMSLRSIIDQAGLITADGIGIVMVSRLRGGNLPERVTGYDTLLKLLDSGNQKKWSFYFLGADPLTSEKACEVIREKYPNLIIAGRHHGFFNSSEEEQIVEEIGMLKPDILVVALGAPYAERWIHQFNTQLHAKIAIGVGGSLDVIAGKVKETPEIWKRLNLEWLFRLKQQPSRWKRQLILPRFAIRALFFRGSK